MRTDENEAISKIQRLTDSKIQASNVAKGTPTLAVSPSLTLSVDDDVCSFLHRLNRTRPFQLAVFLQLAVIFIVSLAVSGTLPSTLAFADEPDQLAMKLLDECWSPVKRKEADKIFMSRQAETVELLYAYALVKSRQHAVDTAINTIDQLQKLDPKHARSLRLKAWLQLRKDKFTAAVVTTGKYIELISADKSLDDFPRMEAYRFAGRVLGFAEGPVASKVNVPTRDAIKRKILFGLNADLTNAFSFEYQSVIDEFERLTGKRKKVETKAAERDAERRKLKFAQLGVFEEQLAENQEKLADASSDVRENAGQQLNALRNADRPLASQQASLESELSWVTRDLFLLINDRNAWLHRANLERDPVLRADFFFRARSLNPVIMERRFAAAAIRRQIDLVESERYALRQQYASTSFAANQELASIANLKKNVNRQQRRTASEKLKTTQPSNKIITESVSLKTRARSILTYEKFPLELERQLLLDDLKK